MARLNRNAIALTALDVARHEAELLDAAFRKGVPRDGGRHGDRGRDLRLHNGGDFRDAESLAALLPAVERLLGRGLGSPWGMTHARLARVAFGPVSMLGSIQRVAEIEEVMDLGLPPALTVEAFPNGSRPFQPLGSPVKFVPCRNEALDRPITCVECRLCLDAEALWRRGLGIAFKVHGRDAAKASAVSAPLSELVGSDSRNVVCLPVVGAEMLVETPPLKADEGENGDNSDGGGEGGDDDDDDDDNESAPLPGEDPERLTGTIRIVRAKVNTIRGIEAEGARFLEAKKAEADRERVEVGREIYEREFGGDDQVYLAYGAQRPLFQRLAERVDEEWTTLRSWVEAHRLERKFQTPETLRVSQILALQPLDLRSDEDETFERRQEAIRSLAITASQEAWSARRIERKARARRIALGLRPADERKTSKDNDAAEDDNLGEPSAPLLGPEPTPEDLVEVLDAFWRCEERRAPEARPAFRLALLDRVRGRWGLDADDGAKVEPVVAQITKQLDRVYNTANRSRRVRDKPFRAEVAGAYARVTQGDWLRVCEPKALVAALAQLPGAVDPPEEQLLVGERGATLHNKAQDVRDVVDEVSRRTE